MIYLMSLGPLRVDIPMEDDVLHIRQSADDVKEKLRAILAANCDNGVISIVPIDNIDMRPLLLLFLHAHAHALIITIIKHHLMKSPVSVGGPVRDDGLGLPGLVAAPKHVAEKALHHGQPLRVRNRTPIVMFIRHLHYSCGSAVVGPHLRIHYIAL